jgi:protein TonB
MSYAIASAEEIPFKKFLVYSVCFHVALAAVMLVGYWIQHSGENWGGIGGDGENNVKVNLVSSAGIPMPQPTNVTDSGVVDPTKSLHNPEPLPPLPEPKTESTPLPKFKEEKPLPPSKKSKVFEKKTPEPDNAVPGKGGSMTLPSGFNNQPGPINGGVSMQGEGGDFAGRYPWYVQAMRRVVGQNWNQNEYSIDPSIRAARKAKTTVTFSINRDGTIKSIKVSDSSGNKSMDDAAMRSLLSIDRLPPLPPDYSGSYVNVSFDFGFDLPL